MMSFQLIIIDVQTGSTAEILLSDADRELLSHQMTRCVACGGLEHFAQWIGGAFASALPATVDYDLRPPSVRQVQYAMAIARRLGMALSPDVLRYRGPMHDFLSTHKEAFDARRGSRYGLSPTSSNEGTEDAVE